MRELCTVALGGVEEDSLREIEACVTEHLGCTVRRLPPMGLPSGSFDEQRGQWSSVLLLRHLLAVAPPGCLRILGVTECDLFIPMLSFVYGQAQLSGRAAVVSTARLSQQFYGLPANDVLLHARARKEVVHETGHLYGLVHCADTQCAMSLSTNVRQIDLKHDSLCAACRAQVWEGHI